MARYSSVFGEGLFSGQVCVVTAGGSGSGRCTAHELAALGAHLVLIGRKLAKLELVREEISVAGAQAEVAALDVRDEESVRAFPRADHAPMPAFDGFPLSKPPAILSGEAEER